VKNGIGILREPPLPPFFSALREFIEVRQGIVLYLYEEKQYG